MIQVTNWRCMDYFGPIGGPTSAKISQWNGRSIAILFKSIWVRGQFDDPDRCCLSWEELNTLNKVSLSLASSCNCCSPSDIHTSSANNSVSDEPAWLH